MTRFATSRLQALNQWSRSYQNLHNFQLFHDTEIGALQVLCKRFGQARLQNEAEDQRLLYFTKFEIQTLFSWIHFADVVVQN